jgi:O-antigen/teichoic acid export membrane protein
MARDTSIVLVGTAASQGLLILFLPVLAHVYTPSDFGVWGIFQSAATLLAVVATLRYELVIYMGETDEDAAEAMMLVLLAALAVSVAMIPFIALFGGAIARAWGDQAIAPYLWLLCPHAFVAGAGVAVLSWWARNRQFRRNAAYRIALNASTVILQLAFSLVAFAGQGLGLIVGTVCAQWLVTIGGLLVIVIGNRELFLRKWKAAQFLDLARRYRRFPLFTLPNSLLEQGYIQVVTLLLGTWFSAAVVGNFYLALRLSYSPLNLLTGAIGQAFLPQMARAAPNLRPLSTGIARLLRLLLLTMIPVIIGVATYGSTILTFVLGHRWAYVGPFAAYMILAYAFVALFTWIGQIFDVIQKQSVNLALGIVLHTIMLGSLVAGYYVTHEPVATIATFAIAVLLLNITWFLVAVRTANLEAQVVLKPLLAGTLSALVVGAAALLSNSIIAGIFGTERGLYAFFFLVALYYAGLGAAFQKGKL